MIAFHRHPFAILVFSETRVVRKFCSIPLLVIICILQEATSGCVRVINNVRFDWLEESSTVHDPAADPSRPLLALILTPTRELAIQINNHITAAAKHTHIKVRIVFCIILGGCIANISEILASSTLHYCYRS